MYYFYEGHLGTLYATEKKKKDWELFCWTCGDSDWFIGEATTEEEAWKLFVDKIDKNSSGGYQRCYVKELIRSVFENEAN